MKSRVMLAPAFLDRQRESGINQVEIDSGPSGALK